VFRGRCLSYGDGITFYPVAEVVRDAAGIADQDSAEEARRKIRAVGAGLDQPDSVATGVAELVGMAEGSVAAEDAFWALRTFLEGLAQNRPLVVVFDDIHWAEPAFLDLVEHIADWTRDAPILLLCVARPELLDLRPGWAGGKLNATSILLEPLGSEQCSELIDNMLGAEGLPAAARSRILEAAEGNPLFVEEMLGMLIDDGLLRRENGHWTASDEVVRVAVPPTIQLLLAARLDRLDAEERAVAERASIEGKVFHRGAVTRLSPDRDRQQVRTRLLALARKELIRPDRATFAGEDAFRFRHLLIRDAAYQGMPKEARADLHLRFADWLAEQAGDRLPEYEDILGYHLEQAYRYRQELGPVDQATQEVAERALKALASSARRAIDRDDTRAAEGLLRRAIDVAGTDPVERRELRWELAEMLAENSDFQAALTLCEEVIEEAAAARDRRIEALAVAHRAFLKMVLDPSVTAQEVLQEAEKATGTLREIGDRIGAMRASRAVSFLRFVLGRVDECAEIVRARLKEARGLGSQGEIRRSTPELGGAMYYGSTPVSEAVALILASLPAVAESRIATAETLLQLPALYAMQGDFEEARRVAAEDLAILMELGHRVRIATRTFWTGPMHVLAGEFDSAERELRESVAMLEAMNEKGFLSTIVADLAEVLVAQNRFDEAEHFALYARDLTSEDDVVSQFEWRSAQAAVLASRGEFDEAERLAREAVELGDGTDYVDHRGGLHMRLAEVLAGAGRTEDASAEVTVALALWERKQNLVSATRARRLLEGLRA